jgi:superfamily II DNA helicase RecQ
MALASEISTKSEIIHATASRLGIVLKQQQKEAIEAFLEGKDVFVALPTGFGKSFIFCLLPALFDVVRSNSVPTSIAIVVSPLVALMKEMKSRFLPRGINAEFLGELQDDSNAIDRIIEGKHHLIFMSPETLLENSRVRGMLQRKVYMDNLVAVVVDEAHCIHKWYCKLYFCFLYMH